ncbi:unnamed protein product [Nesidiocoris tenuis]|uniref:Large ribosomal subunit protein uL18m n=1 Tax=Nesidiocoris tenuis TaxID=355587 RepID=A0A6H5GWQ2_9HEMI|nr:unnamed protein product [Nesidiocoris tenuis]
MTHFLPPAKLPPKLALQRAKLPAEYVLNRNPRSLEKICIAYKPAGWELETPGRNYWHKLFIERTSRNVSAYVKHYTGHVPLTASTKEWAIKKHLFSTVDRCAHINLARVLALRCLQSGITEMICDHAPPEGPPRSNMDAFLAVLVENGVSLTEPDQYKNPRPSEAQRPEKPWTLHD